MSDQTPDDLGARIKAAQEARQGRGKTDENTAESPANAGNAVLQHGSELFAVSYTHLTLPTTSRV